MSSAAEDVLITAREMLRRGLVTGSAGNVSARDGEQLLITPAGLPYERMELADLVRLDRSGAVVEGRREPSSERRVHLAVYGARPEAGALVHTHSVHATAWSMLGQELDTGTEELTAAAGGAVRTAPQAPSGSDEIARAAVEALAGRRAALLERHGVVALGATPAEALEVATAVERQAQMALLVRR